MQGLYYRNQVWGKYAMVIYANNKDNKATKNYSAHDHIVNVETLFGSKNSIK